MTKERLKKILKKPQNKTQMVLCKTLQTENPLCTDCDMDPQGFSYRKVKKWINMYL